MIMPTRKTSVISSWWPQVGQIDRLGDRGTLIAFGAQVFHLGAEAFVAGYAVLSNHLQR
jgi:hypothetical protein